MSVQFSASGRSDWIPGLSAYGSVAVIWGRVGAVVGGWPGTGLSVSVGWLGATVSRKLKPVSLYTLI